jgi:hypothetical protein
MIIARLYGGLGNQLFQYAAARRIASVNKAPLKLDTSFFESDKLRQYKLHYFNIQAEPATSQEMAFFIEAGARSLPVRLLNQCKPYYKRYFIQEKSLEFDPNLLKATGNVYLWGYWQSENYFADIQDLLRREFTMRHEPDEMNREMLRQIRAVNSVCLHVRRGDYVSNPLTKQIHGVCGTDYYQKAIAELTRLVSAPHFFVFSDDPEWTLTNLKFEHSTTFVTHNDADREYEDLRLMAACQHYIIANSSFSWWGAWLGSCAEKVVIAPQKWGNDPTLNTRNRIPAGWLTI